MWWLYIFIAVLTIYLLSIYLLYIQKKVVQSLFEKTYQAEFKLHHDEEQALRKAFETIRSNKHFEFLSCADIENLITVFRPLRLYRRELFEILIGVVHRKRSYSVLQDAEKCVVLLTDHVSSGDLKLRLSILRYSLATNTNADYLIQVLDKW